MAKQLDSSSQDEMSEIVLPSKYSLGSKLSDFGVPEDMIDIFMKTGDASHLFNFCQEPESKNQLSELLNSFAPTLQSMITGDQALVALPSRVQNVHEANRKANDDSSSLDEMSEIVLPSKYSLGSKLSDFGVPEDLIDIFMKTCDASHLLIFCKEPESKNQLSELLKSFAPTLRSMMTEIEEIVDRSQYSIDESRLISFGGDGKAYKGKWRGKTVAVKRLYKVGQSMTESLVRKIKRNALVNHPNIVVLHAYSKYEGKMVGRCFDFIMEFIDGLNLYDAVFDTKLEYLQTDRGKLTTALKVSGAIAYIHSIGLIHSDIKPENILIRKSDNEPFVCDLWLGHDITSLEVEETRWPDFAISKRAPPESGPGYVATYEGDVWSLACVLLELFTGHRLWENIARAGNEHVPELTINQIVIRFLCGNFTPDILSLVDIAAVHDALQSCFTGNIQNRPSAKDLTEFFEGALSSVNE